jgi:hypothetical protein
MTARQRAFVFGNQKMDHTQSRLRLAVGPDYLDMPLTTIIRGRIHQHNHSEDRLPLAVRDPAQTFQQISRQLTELSPRPPNRAKDARLAPQGCHPGQIICQGG